VPPEEKRIAAFNRALAGVIRRRREELGFSLTQLGTLSGLSQQSVSYIERQKRVPIIETLVRIADALDIPLSVLIELTEKEVCLLHPRKTPPSKK